MYVRCGLQRVCLPIVICLVATSGGGCIFNSTANVGRDGSTDRPMTDRGNDLDVAPDRDAMPPVDVPMDRPDVPVTNDIRSDRDAAMDLPVDLPMDRADVPVEPPVDLPVDLPIDLPPDLPTRVVTLGANSTDTQVLVLDTELVVADPATSYEGGLTITVGAGMLEANGILFFNVASLAGRTVLTAELELYVENPSSQAVDFHLLLQNWSAQATWNEAMPGSVAWSSPGCDMAGPCRVDPPLASAVFGTSDVMQVVPLPASAVQAWIDMPGTNLGLLLRMATTNDRDMGFTATEGMDGRRPRLRLSLAP
jgi:hypothetical protein